MSFCVEYAWKSQLEHERIRRALRAELRHVTMAYLGQRLDVPPEAIYKLVHAGHPDLTGDQWQALETFRQAHPLGEPEPAAVALAILVDGFPVPRRSRIRAAVVHQLHEAYEETGAPLPGWIEEEILGRRYRPPDATMDQDGGGERSK